MIVNDLGDVTITNDGATILGQLEIQHPAAKLLIELATQQDMQVGDGTTTVVLYAAEFLDVSFIFFYFFIIFFFVIFIY
jgi:T-complex protein 1 subunit alpha